MSMQQVAGLISGGAVDYEIERSVRFNSADSAYLNRTPSSAGNRKTWTWSGWVKRSKSALQMIFDCNGGTSNSTYGFLSFRAGDTLLFGAYTTTWRETTAVYRDYSAWYHIVVAFDTTQATASDRVRIYINGDEVTDFSTSNDPALNTDYAINQAQPHNLGKNYGSYGYFDGYLADVHFIDGQALAPSDFGEPNDDGVWNPKRYSGSYGTNGFHLDFSDNSSAAALGTDTSGNSNTWTVNNLSVASGAGNDSLIDTPTNYEASSGNNGGNYCTMNPLAIGSFTLSNGNLDIVSTGSYAKALSTFGMSSGKWYYESTINVVNQYNCLGIANSNAFFKLTEYAGQSNTDWTYLGDGRKVSNAGRTSYGSSYSSGDIVGVAFDADAGTLTFYVNGVSQGTAFTGLTSGPYFPVVIDDSNSNQTNQSLNFGQRPFAYTPPTGYKSLCTTNLPDPTIADGSTAMDVLTWSGSGGNRSFSSFSLSPDLVWIKQRNQSYSVGHQIYDIVRGAGSLKQLDSSNTTAEGGGNTDDYGYLSSFDSAGFSVTSGSIGSDYVNKSGVTYVGWAWDGGTTTATNTDGSITSNVRANQSAGFSIVSYTGDGSGTDTIGHGLNDAPSLVITKSRGTTGSWRVFTDVGGTWKLGNLNNTDAFVNATVSAPTSSVFSIDGNSNASTTHIAYCFAPVSQYSAFGVYTGNGSSDGPMVFTGFRPRWILIKNSSTSEYWRLYDTERSTENVMDDMLMPNDSAAETTSTVNILDALSNGFKLRGTHSSTNGSGNTIIYAAFAEHPFKTARAR